MQNTLMGFIANPQLILKRQIIQILLFTKGLIQNTSLGQRERGDVVGM